MSKRKRSISQQKSTYDESPDGCVISKDKKITEYNSDSIKCRTGDYFLTNIESKSVVSRLQYEIILNPIPENLSYARETGQELYVRSLHTIEGHRGKG